MAGQRPVETVNSFAFMKTTHLLSIALLSSLPMAIAREPKEYDRDVNYEESRLPKYTLPPLLATPDGKRITSPEEWQQTRRPQILALFSNLIYGKVPQPAEPIEQSYEVVETDPEFMGGKATRKDVKIRFSNSKGKIMI